VHQGHGEEKSVKCIKFLNFWM